MIAYFTQYRMHELAYVNIFMAHVDVRNVTYFHTHRFKNGIHGDKHTLVSIFVRKDNKHLAQIIVLFSFLDSEGFIHN